MIININQRFRRKKKILVSIQDLSFQYGHGVFETLRTYEKVPLMANKHVDRLLKSAKLIDLKVIYGKEKILEIIHQVAAKSTSKNQRIKIIAKKGLLIVTSKKLISSPQIKKGVACKSINATRSFPKAKTTSYLDSYIPHQKAANAGFFEALLMNDQEEVSEGAYSNVFWFEKDTLCTPKKNALDGITKSIICKISPYDVEYKNIKLYNLKRKTDVFLTQSTNGIIPVTQIDGTLINGGKIGSKTKNLIKLFDTYINEQLNKLEQ